MPLTKDQLLLVVAQQVHALIGAFLFYLLSTYFPGSLLAVAITYGGLLGVEVWKEGFWDMANEPGATYAGGLVDGMFYYIGAGIALVALLLTHRPL